MAIGMYESKISTLTSAAKKGSGGIPIIATP